jgi:hypothetical protein
MVFSLDRVANETADVRAVVAQLITFAASQGLSLKER